MKLKQALEIVQQAVLDTDNLEVTITQESITIYWENLQFESTAEDCVKIINCIRQLSKHGYRQL